MLKYRESPFSCLFSEEITPTSVHSYFYRNLIRIGIQFGMSANGHFSPWKLQEKPWPESWLLFGDIGGIIVFLGTREVLSDFHTKITFCSQEHSTRRRAKDHDEKLTHFSSKENRAKVLLMTSKELRQFHIFHANFDVSSCFELWLIQF